MSANEQNLPSTMRAAVLDAPGPPSALAIRELPIPVPSAGWVLIRVRAFGLNRLELYLRLGLSERVTLGAVPEMLQTAYGSLTTGLDACPGQSILIRGGTSSVGLATMVLARQRGMTILSTTRNPGKAGAVTKAGADHVLIDDGHVARQVREILPGGADTALELVGTPTLPDTLRSLRVHGVVCFTGMLSSQWTVRDFYPIDYLPTGVRLTAYKGDAADLPPRVLQDFLDAVAADTAAVPIGRVYRFGQITQAHTDMEQNRTSGKLVVTT